MPRSPTTVARGGSRTPSADIDRDIRSTLLAAGRGVGVPLGHGVRLRASLGKATTGAFAELVAVNEDEIARKPAGLSMAEAAALPMVTLTAWQALVEKRACDRATGCLSMPAPV